MAQYNENLNKLRQMLSEELNKTKEVKKETVVEQSAIDEFRKLIKEAAPKIDKATPQEVIEIEDTITRLSNHFMKASKPAQINEQDSLEPLNQRFVTFDQMNKHYSDFLVKLQTQLSTLGGGGEVEFRYLDDVNRSTMTPSNDNWVLEYDAASKKAQFTNQIGPIETLWFDPTHNDTHDEEGLLTWNQADRTLNIHHQNSVTQQVGQETYFVVKNVTGSDIPNGTFCSFAGVTANGVQRIDAAPFLADGTYPNLYGIGVATENIPNGGVGFVTTFGMVRGLNTTGSDVTETWLVGDILYAHPTQAGKLTKVKPTAPSNVLPAAAVIFVDATEGEIFVRPTLEQRMDYGTVNSTVNQEASTTINTPKAITYNTTEVVNGISVDGTDTSKIVFEQSGLYTVTINTQVLSTNASEKKVWLWLRKNGTDVPYSSRVISIVGNLEYKVLHVAYNISMNAGDYIQFMFAANATAIRLQAEPATAFAPAAPSVRVHIDQGAL